MARNRLDGEIVALKKVRMDNEKEGFPITAIREIKILKSLDHKNVIKLKEIVTSKVRSPVRTVLDLRAIFLQNFLITEQDQHLYGIWIHGSRSHRSSWSSRDKNYNPSDKVRLPPFRSESSTLQRKNHRCYMKQLLTGLTYCHLNNILHRDIKGSNLLIDNQGVLKLADFGLARPCALENSKTLTNRVITLWYRPPELLLGTQTYGPAVDMWSAGCIFAELLYGKPILPVRDSSFVISLGIWIRRPGKNDF